MRSSGPILALAALLLVALGPASARAGDDKPMPEHKITQAESYVGLNPMYATILDNGRPVGLLLVSIGLNIPGRTSAQRNHPCVAGAARFLSAQSDDLYGDGRAALAPARCRDDRPAHAGRDEPRASQQGRAGASRSGHDPHLALMRKARASPGPFHARASARYRPLADQAVTLTLLVLPLDVALPPSI